jgi:ADP-heptose:LPS heptosyltransferase
LYLNTSLTIVISIDTRLKKPFIFLKHTLLLFADALTLSLVKKKGTRKSQNDIDKTIVFIRLDAIGDFLLVLPYLKEIKKCFHHSDDVTILIGNILWKDLGEYFLRDTFARFIWIDRKKYKNNIYYRIKMNQCLSKISANKVMDSAYNRDYIYNDSVIRAISANRKIGWMGETVGVFPVLSRLSQKSYTELLENVDYPLEVDKQLHFFKHVLKMEINPSYKINSKVGDISKYGLPENYCVIVPGASWHGREWNIDKFAVCSDYINSKFDRVTVLIGSSSENSKYDKIKKTAKTQNIINCIGKTNLLDMIEIIRNADLLISNETSAIHIAALTDTKAICVFGGGHFGRFVPNHNIKHIRWVYKEMECFGCNWKCIFNIKKDQAVPCIANVMPVEMFRFIDDLLSYTDEKKH